MGDCCLCGYFFALSASTLPCDQTHRRKTWTPAKTIKYGPQILSLSWPTGTSPDSVVLWTVSCQDLFDLYCTSRSLYSVAKESVGWHQLISLGVLEFKGWFQIESNPETQKPLHFNNNTLNKSINATILCLIFHEMNSKTWNAFYIKKEQFLSNIVHKSV